MTDLALLRGPAGQIGTVNGGTGDVTVRALHIVIPGVLGTNTDTDVVIAEAHADTSAASDSAPWTGTL